MNSGKTLYMVFKLYTAWRSGKIIMTNLDLAFPHYKINRDFMIKLGQEQPVLENVAFGLDEFWIWFDAYQHRSGQVVSYFFNQSSKDDTEIYITLQHNRQIDVRLRDNCHKVYQCSRVLLQDGKFLNISEEQRFLPEKYHKQLYIKVIEFKRISVGMVTEMIPINESYIPAWIIFPLFDTRQKINIRGKVV